MANPPKRGPGGPGGGHGRGPGRPFQKPKNMGKTVRRLFGYVSHSKLLLLLVGLCLLASVFTNLGGSYMQRGIINNFITSLGLEPLPLIRNNGAGTREGQGDLGEDLTRVTAQILSSFYQTIVDLHKDSIQGQDHVRQVVIYHA